MLRAPFAQHAHRLDQFFAGVLSRMCVKLREGDAIKFLKELMILRGKNQED